MSVLAGLVEIGGTLLLLIAGAAPGTPPRGTVRNTWLSGNGCFSVR